MEAFDAYQNKLVSQTKNLFSEYPEIKWLNPYLAIEASELRDKLISNLTDNWLFSKTKPFYKQLSKGCKLCGLGSWSCLFITGKCNAGCFYCPASQLKDEPPSTQSFTFETPESYAEYINFFKFKAVSFSGGEPLLFFERTLQYLKQIRKKCSPDIYTWMYTNGILADETKFKKLVYAGLDEVRFDIGATGFKLDKIKAAKGIVPNITIEIPAVPEEKEQLKKLLPEMIKAGVTNLNLHQLRLTKHNAPKLIRRGYTFIPAEQPIALESELAALEILNYARDHHFEIGINYCSFFFKNRFQPAGFRKQVANTLAEPDEIITRKGFIRKLDEHSLEYKTIRISDKKTAENSVAELKLKHKTYYIKRETILKRTDFDEITHLKSILKSEPEQIPSDSAGFNVWQMEYIEKGLREY